MQCCQVYIAVKRHPHSFQGSANHFMYSFRSFVRASPRGHRHVHPKLYPKSTNPSDRGGRKHREHGLAHGAWPISHS